LEQQKDSWHGNTQRHETWSTLVITYVEKILIRFGIKNVKLVNIPLDSHFKLSSSLWPNNIEEKDYMSLVPYASAVGSLIDAMVCTRRYISHAVGVVSMYICFMGKACMGKPMFLS
jgi:hypothetical protein